MNKLFRNAQGRLRNGWWILLFLALFVASQWLYRPVHQGLQHIGIAKDWLAPLPVVFLLGISWACMRLRRQPLSGIGLKLDGAWLRLALVGLAFGAAQMLAVAALIALAGGVRFELDAARSAAALAWGAWFFLSAAAIEELLFRGFVFQRLVDGIGAPAALLLASVLFALAHWGNPGMQGATLVVASLDTALGALLLGLAWLRTGSLALPLGIHFAWNWTQGALLGFGVSGQSLGQGQSGWLHPQLLDAPQWLSGGTFGPEASVFALVVNAAAIGLLWHWKGVKRQPRAALLPAG